MLLAFAVSLALSAAPDVAGRWEGDGFTLVLAEGGGGTISDGPGVPPERISWKAAPGVLNITQEGDTIPYQMKLANGSMTLSSVVLDRPITLKRVGAANAKTAPAPAMPPPTAKTPKQPAAPQVKVQPPTCEGACQHYLTCAKLGAENFQGCVAQCYVSGANAAQLATYVQLDCQQAIAVIVAAQLQALQAAQGAQQGRQGNGQQNSSRCQGCVRDGNDCVWMSQSDWGHGTNSPYSGAVTSCDADCCGL